MIRRGSRSPDPIPQRQLIDSQMSAESRGKREGTREHPSRVAQDVEHRALQRLRSSSRCRHRLSPAPQPCCTPSPWGHPKDSNLWVKAHPWQPGTFLPSTTASYQFTLEGQSCPAGIPGLSPQKGSVLRCQSHADRKRKCAFSVAAALRSRNEL